MKRSDATVTSAAASYVDGVKQGRIALSEVVTRCHRGSLAARTALLTLARAGNEEAARALADFFAAQHCVAVGV